MCNWRSRKMREDKKIFEEIMVKEFSNLVKIINAKNKAQKNSKPKKQKKPTLQLITIKLLKTSDNKKNIIISQKNRHIIYIYMTEIRMTLYF